MAKSIKNGIRQNKTTPMGKTLQHLSKHHNMIDFKKTAIAAASISVASIITEKRLVSVDFASPLCQRSEYLGYFFRGVNRHYTEHFVLSILKRCLFCDLFWQQESTKKSAPHSAIRVDWRFSIGGLALGWIGGLALGFSIGVGVVAFLSNWVNLSLGDDLVRRCSSSREGTSRH